MSAVRFAAAIAFSRDRRQRWRQVSILLAGVIGVLVCLLTVALPLAARDAYERGSSRAPIWDPALVAEPGEPAPGGASLAIVQLASIVDGAQIPTIWVEPLPGHEEDPAIVPDGLETLPAPGTAVLSPALQREGYSAEDFGWRPSDAGSDPGGAIGESGLMTASERLIYVRPAEGRTLGSGPSVLFTTGFENYRSPGPAFVTDPEIPPPGWVRTGAVVFVLVPGLVVLISATRARSGLREQRLALMVTFGLRARIARSVLAMETSLLALIGAVIGSFLYPVASMLLSSVPGTRIQLAAGGLAVPWWAYPSAVAATALLAGVCGALGRLEHKGARPARRRVRSYGLVGLIVSLGCLVASSSSSNPLTLVMPVRDAQSAMLTAGTLGSILTAPLAIPAVTAVVARIVERSRRPSLWAAGRRLRFDAVRMSRVASALSILIVVLSTASALWGANAISQAEVAQGRSPLTARDVSWRGAEVEDPELAEERLEDVGLNALFLPTVEPDEEFEPQRLVVEDCERFTAYFGKDSGALCGDENVDSLEVFVQSMTGMGLARATDGEQRVAEDAVVVTRRAAPLAEIQQALGPLPGLNIAVRASDVSAPLPLRQWIMAGALSTLALLGTAVLREIGDRSLDDAERDAQYLRLGLGARTADALAWLVLLIPLSVGVVLSFVTSVLIAYQGQAALVMQGDPVRLVIVAGTALAIACVAILVAGPARRALRSM